MTTSLPFFGEDHDLDGVSPQKAFRLGYELALVVTEVMHAGSCERPIHTDNMERLKRIVESNAWWLERDWINDDFQMVRVLRRTSGEAEEC